MVYKKYLKRDGKNFGPYYYESYRVGDKVKKIYIGDKKDYEKWKSQRGLNAIKKHVEQPGKSSGFTRALFFISFILLFVSIFIIFAATFNQTVFKKSFTGFAVGENVSESSELNSGLVYAKMEGETITESIDTSSIDLKIKEPVRFGGQAVSENKNKRMDFDTPNGQIRLYFDLLNYSEFVENIADQINATVKKTIEEDVIESNVTEELDNSPNITTSPMTNVTNVSSPQINITNTTIVNNTLNETVSQNVSEIFENQTTDEQQVNNTNIDSINPIQSNTSDQTQQQTQTLSPEVSAQSDLSAQSSNPESAVSESSNPSSGVSAPEGQGITGNIIKIFAIPLGFMGRIVGVDEVNEGPVSYVNSDVSSLNITEVKEKIEDLSLSKNEIKQEEAEQIIENAADNSVVKAEDFEINISSVPNGTENSKNAYKWGYKVKLKDLKFMAKIDVTSNQSISQYDSYSLQIGNNLLSFSDLVDRGYSVRIDMPALEMNLNYTASSVANVTEDSINASQSLFNETIINNTNETIDNSINNITETNNTNPSDSLNNVIENNSAEINNISNASEEIESSVVNNNLENNLSQAGITGNSVKNLADDSFQTRQVQTEKKQGLADIIKIIGVPFKLVQSLISFTGRVVGIDENNSNVIEQSSESQAEQPQELPSEQLAENQSQSEQPAEPEQSIQPEQNISTNIPENISNLINNTNNENLNNITNNISVPQQPVEPVQPVEEIPLQNQTKIKIDDSLEGEC